MSKVISGSVDNGRRALVDLPFYKGEVGVRERGSLIELAWFGRVPTFRGAVEGMLDEQPIRVLDLQSRELISEAAVRQRTSPTRMIVATAALIEG